MTASLGTQAGGRGPVGTRPQCRAVSCCVVLGRAGSCWAAALAATATSVLVGAEVEVVERYGLASGGVAEVVVVVAVTRDGVRVGPRLLGRLHPDVAVPLEAGAR